jgi:membrane-bound lytic murein transglycosylase D
VELFQGRLREFMQNGLDRAQRYLPMIQNVFRAEGLPLDLAYVPLVESAFKSTALSRVAARGMWQFMLPTAREHGLNQTWFLDERSDPEKATRAAAQYLKTLQGMFDGDWEFALASYNAGPGRLQRAVRQSKSTDFWQITASTRYLAPRDARIRPDDPGRDHHRQEPRALRVFPQLCGAARLLRPSRSPVRLT